MQSDRDALETRRALEEAEKNVLAGQLAQQRLKEEELMRQRVRVEQEKYLVQVVHGSHASLLGQNWDISPHKLIFKYVSFKTTGRGLVKLFFPCVFNCLLDNLMLFGVTVHNFCLYKQLIIDINFVASGLKYYLLKIEPDVP